MRRTLHRVPRVAGLLVLQALVLWAVAGILPWIAVPSIGAALLVVVIIGVLQVALWSLIIRLLLPVAVLTFGLASLWLSAVVVRFAVYAVDGDIPGWGGAIAVAFALAASSMLAGPLFGLDGDARSLRIVRRRVRRLRDTHRTDVPGVILFEIDGLGEGVLREAIAAGHVPTIARWLEDGSHRIQPWECDLSSQTGASQAGLLLGSNDDMPGFRWYERDTGRLMVSNHPKDAAEIERRHSTGHGLLADGGTSRGNLVSGDAPRASATMSVVRDRARSRSGEFFAYFADAHGLLRSLALAVGDMAEEKVWARRQRRSGADHVDRGGVYPLIRAVITVLMRDINTATLMADIVEGVPVSYATYVGYDEVAHHSGIAEPDAFAVLRRHDKQLARLERAVALAPRPYHLVVLSDHGQTAGRPFRQRCGQTLEEVVRGAIERGRVAAPPPVPEAWGAVGAWLGELRAVESAGGRVVRRLTEGRAADDRVLVGPEREAAAEEAALERAAERPELLVLASGCLGLVYFPRATLRLTAEEIRRDQPGLLVTLAQHPEIGWLMVRTQEYGAVVLGAGGSHRLHDGHVEGEDPLAGYGEHAAAHLRRHDGFAHCPDILVNGRYDPATGEVAPFEEFMGSHGGLGGPQMQPFAVVPSAWSAAATPIVGCAAMHQRLRGWLRETTSGASPGRAAEGVGVPGR